MPIKLFQAELAYMPLSDEVRFLPECPRILQNFRAAGSTLGWVAIQHSQTATSGSLNLLDLKTRQNQSIALPGRPGFFAETDAPGVVVVGMDRRLVLVDLESGVVEEIGLTATDDERVIINDGMAVEGGILFGTKHLTFSEKIAKVYFFEAAERRIHTVLDGQICSNGKFLFEREGRPMLADIDSFQKRVALYEVDWEQRRLIEQGTIADFSQTPLFPDGLRPTPDGKSIIVAFYNPQPVRDGLAQQIRIEDGTVEAEWLIPGSPRVTCPELALTGGEVKVWFTTAVEGAPEDVLRVATEAGGMFVADTGLNGEPVPPPLVSAIALRG